MSTAFPIPRSDRRVDLTATAAQTVLTFPYPVLENQDVGVAVQAPASTLFAALTYGVDYTVSGAPSNTGVTVTLTAPAVAGAVYRLTGARVPSRTTSLAPYGSSYRAALEAELDNMTLVLQELRRDFRRLEDFVNGAASNVASLTEARAGVSNAVVMSPLRTSDALGARRTDNPFGSTYPSYLYGIGGTFYYDIQTLAKAGVYLETGSASFTNPFTYGGLNSAMGLTATANSNRPGMVAGFTAPGQSSGYDEFGGCALGAQVDSVPLIKSVAGTFTATTFTPAAPFTMPSGSYLAVGMWLRTDDSPAAFNGQITSFATNASGQISQITVSNWYKRGANGASATPSGSRVFINPQDKVWGHLNTVFLNKFTITGTTTVGTTQITGVSSVANLYPDGQFVTGNNIPAGAVITGVDYYNNIIYISANATGSGATTMTVSAGTEFNKGVAAEIDIFNAAPAFSPVYITDTGNITNGGYTVTNITSISQWRSGLVIKGTGIPYLNIVTHADYSTNTLTLKYPCTATASGVALKAYNQLDEGGVGFDFVSVVNNAQAAIVQRGAWSYGFKSHGAVYASFLCRPDFDCGLPSYGFRVDTRLNGAPTTAAFAIGDSSSDFWKVDGSGNSYAATYRASDGTQILDNGGWTTYTPTLSAGSGTFTSATVTGKHKRIGRTRIVDITVTITTNGTAASYVQVTLPDAPSRDTMIDGRGSTVGALIGVIPANNAYAIVQKFDLTYPGANSAVLLIRAEYEIT